MTVGTGLAWVVVWPPGGDVLMPTMPAPGLQPGHSFMAEPSLRFLETHEESLP